jgi:hypothetical protein
MIGGQTQASQNLRFGSESPGSHHNTVRVACLTAPSAEASLRRSDMPNPPAPVLERSRPQPMNRLWEKPVKDRIDTADNHGPVRLPTDRCSGGTLLHHSEAGSWSVQIPEMGLPRGRRQSLRRVSRTGSSFKPTSQTPACECRSHLMHRTDCRGGWAYWVSCQTESRLGGTIDPAMDGMPTASVGMAPMDMVRGWVPCPRLRGHVDTSEVKKHRIPSQFWVALLASDSINRS